MSPSALLGGSFLAGAGGGEDIGKVSIRRHILHSSLQPPTPNLCSLTPQFLLGKEESLIPSQKQQLCGTERELGSGVMLEHF